MNADLAQTTTAQGVEGVADGEAAASEAIVGPTRALGLIVPRVETKPKWR